MKNCPHCDEDISDTFISKDEVEDVSGLKKALASEREGARQANRELAQLRDKHAASSFDSEEVKKQRDTLTKQLDDLKASGELNSGNLTKQLDELKATNAALAEEATNGKIAIAIVKTKGNPKLLMPHVRKMMDEDSALSYDEAAQKAKAEFSMEVGAYKASEQSGTGSDPGRSDVGRASFNQTPTRRSQMTDRQKVDHQKQFGLDSLLNIPE